MENVEKPASISSIKLDDEDFEKIKSYSIVDEVDREKIFAFKVVLCNNEVDRDLEAFTTEALKGLSELFVGKTGIKNHSMNSNDQLARIFKTELVVSEDKLTSYGVPFAELTACAYMVRMASNEDLITEIELGIKKEVSVSCSLAEARCSICGNNMRTNRCQHKPGCEYDGRKCYVELDKPFDAYEFSFVAVPAQIGAGTTKNKALSKREPYPEAVKPENTNTKSLRSALIRAFSIMEE